MSAIVTVVMPPGGESAKDPLRQVKDIFITAVREIVEVNRFNCWFPKNGSISMRGFFTEKDKEFFASYREEENGGFRVVIAEEDDKGTLVNIKAKRGRGAKAWKSLALASSMYLSIIDKDRYGRIIELLKQIINNGNKGGK